MSDPTPQAPGAAAGIAAPPETTAPTTTPAPGTSPTSPGSPTSAGSTARTASAHRAPASRTQRARARMRAVPTPLAMRRLGAAGLLGGLLTGAAAFGALSSDSATIEAGTKAAKESQAISAAQIQVDQARTQALTGAVAGGTGNAATSAYDASVQALGAALSATSGLPDVGLDPAKLTAYAAAVGQARGQGASGPSTVLSAEDGIARSSAALADAKQRSDRQATGSIATSLTASVSAGLVGGVATVGLIGCSIWLARRTHRVINPPLAGAVLLTAAATAAVVAGGVATSDPVDAARASVTSSDATARVVLDHLARARTDELLALSPGRTAAERAASAEDATRWRPIIATKVTELGNEDVAARWRTYAQTAEQSTQNASTQAAAARTAATTTGTNAYDGVVQALTPLTTASELPEPAPWLDAAKWGSLLGGALAGVLAFVGFAWGQREYRR